MEWVASTLHTTSEHGVSSITTITTADEQHTSTASSRLNWRPHRFNLLKPTGHVMHRQFNIQKLYALPTLYLCVLYLSEKKQLIVPLTA